MNSRFTYPVLILTGLLALASTRSAAGQEGWKRASALSAGKGQDYVRVRIASGKAAGTGVDSIDLEYAMPALKVEKRQIKGEKGIDEDITRLILGNAPDVGNPGQPCLPVVPCYVVLPQGQTLDDVNVVCSDPVKLPGTHLVRHAQKPVPLLPDAKAEYTPRDPKVYGSDEPWPPELFKVIGVQKKRGVSILIVNLNPVVYRPKSGKVSYYPSMKLNVTARPAAAKGGIEVRYRPDKARPVSKQVDNPDTLKTYEGSK